MFPVFSTLTSSYCDLFFISKQFLTEFDDDLLLKLLQDEQTIRDRTLLEVRDSDHRIPWKVRFNLGNSSRQITQCRNSIQGKTLLTDELGETHSHPL